MQKKQQRRIRLRFWPKRTSLKQKFGLLITGIVVLMLLSGAANIATVTATSNSMQGILNDNQDSYNLQLAITAEKRAFSNLIRSSTQENEQLYQKAKQQSYNSLQALPRDYRQIGEKRFELTTSIENSYTQYQQKRDQVLAMNPEDSDYIRELYLVFSMQEYLEQYCANLTEVVLQEGNTHYESQAAWLISIPYVLVGISATVLVLLVLVLFSAVGDVMNTLSELAKASRDIQKNDFALPDIVWHSHDEVGQLVSAFNKMKRANQQYVKATEEKSMMEEELHRQELERMDLEKRFSMTQLRLLKNQLNPHFLFNTLNTIARMAQIEGAPVSEQMTIAVSNLLRYNLRTNDPVVPLWQELKVVADYMYIQQMRFGERVRYRLDCTVDTTATHVPVFLLQPLVENAVQHGLAIKENGGSICLHIRQKGDILRIVVSDTGIGMNPERRDEVRAAMAKEGEGLGIGLSNLCRRVGVYYENSQVNIHSREGYGTVLIMEFGCMKQEWR